MLPSSFVSFCKNLKNLLSSNNTLVLGVILIFLCINKECQDLAHIGNIEKFPL